MWTWGPLGEGEGEAGPFDPGAGRFVARFGPWAVETPLANVARAEITGPYSTPKTVGPAHVSLADAAAAASDSPDDSTVDAHEAPAPTS